MRTVARSLALLLLAGCSTRAHSGSGTGPSDPGVVVPGAVPAVVEATADAAGTARPCEIGAPVRIAAPGVHVIGVWFDAAARVMRIATTTTPHEVQLSTFSTSTGALNADRTIALAPDATAETMWRAASGALLIGVRVGTTLHLMQSGPAGLTEIAISRYLDATTETTLGPLDDPSDSQLAGLLATNTSPYWQTGYLCATETVTPNGHPESCVMYVSPQSGIRHTAAVIAGHRYVAHARGLSTVPQPMLAQASGPYDPFSPLPLGRLTSGGYATRRDTADVQRGSPMLASWSGGGAVAWVEPSGPAVVEGFAVGGNIAADPLSLPFVDAELEDIAAGEHEIDVLLVTRADRSATPATTTLVRLTPELRSDSPLVAPPVRVPLSHARMLRVGSDELLLLGEGDTQLAVAHCAP